MQQHSQTQQEQQEIGGYELAERMTGLGRPTLYSLVHERRIPHVRLSGRLVRFRASELRSWLDSHAVAATGT